MIEVGAILYDSEKMESLAKLSMFVKPNGFLVPKEIEAITGISDEMLESGSKLEDVLEEIHSLMRQSDVSLAHNASYDKTIYETECLRLGIEPVQKSWLCTLEDIEYPERFKCRKLSHLALDHGILVDPSTLHRALGDVELMLKLIEKGGYTIDSIYAQHCEPWVVVKAEVNFHENQLAKDAQFRWQRAGDKEYPKSWVKRIKENKLKEERVNWKFRYTIL